MMHSGRDDEKPAGGNEAYEPPEVEDLDTSQGPLVTPAGVMTSTGSTTTTTNSIAAPRQL